MVKSGKVKTVEEKTFFLAAGAFVNNTIWIGSCQTSTQHILNNANRFFEAHRYLGIFLSTEGLSKPNLAQAHMNPIFSYRMQFNFVSVVVCHKWNVIIRKSFKAKTGLLCNFLQVQAKEKLATLIFFSNAYGIIGHLFKHKFLDMQASGQKRKVEIRE
ncbi:hypothetical protein G9A89_005232 [Geosiphon pyriformis]|nr:hypothetical protein G9A89_005232 [Geosiphon pyriformis]